MITKHLKEHLLSLHTKRLDFNGLVKFMESTDTDFLGSSLRGVTGIAKHKSVNLDINILKGISSDIVFFVVLHEYAHSLRIEKMGKSNMIKNLSSKDFDEFVDHLIGEEIIADRYGSYMFYKFNKMCYPRYLTQQLHLEENRDNFSELIGGLHGKIDNSEEKYEELFDSFIIEVDIK